MPTAKYICDECGIEVKRSEKFCHECGAKLDWSEEYEEYEPSTPAPKTKTEKISTTNNNEVNDFINSSMGKGIAMIFFCLLGIVFGTAVLIRRSAIKSRMKGDRIVTSEKEHILKHLRAIEIDAAIACALTCLNVFGSLSRAAQLATTKTTYGYSSTNSADFIGYAILLVGINVIGIVVSGSIKKKATAAVLSLKK
ncbi:MAG: hypothetical protein Q4D22_03975 [Candidatus Saccharibacteria bacterium]|nr:hypothetical protein [Candidatus Saccharibacteria bacterium]